MIRRFLKVFGVLVPGLLISPGSTQAEENEQAWFARAFDLISKNAGVSDNDALKIKEIIKPILLAGESNLTARRATPESLWRDVLNWEEGRAYLLSRGKRATNIQLIDLFINEVLRHFYSYRHLYNLHRSADNRPYAMFSVVGDANDSPRCMQYDGVIVQVSNPWLLDNYPPHEIGCRCLVRSLSERNLAREKLTLTPVAELPNIQQ